ncbi:hypothetical protein RYX36_028408 [Vicia faba]
MNKNNNSSQSSSKGNPKKSSIITCGAKMVKPNRNNQTKMVDFVESIAQNPTLKPFGDAVQDSFNKESVILGDPSTPDEETGKASKNIERIEASKNIVEVYGAPHQKKKMAADDAAEGALWYLKHIGFVLKN